MNQNLQNIFDRDHTRIHFGGDVPIGTDRLALYEWVLGLNRGNSRTTKMRLWCAMMAFNILGETASKVSFRNAQAGKCAVLC